jgi:hypothetical protein
MAAALRPLGRGGARRWRRRFSPCGREEHCDGGVASARAAMAAALRPVGRGGARRWRSSAEAAPPLLVCEIAPEPRVMLKPHLKIY